MLFFLFNAASDLESIPDGVFPKRQAVGTAVTTITAGTTITTSVVASTPIMSSSSPALELSSSTPAITTTSTPAESSTPIVAQSSTTTSTTTPIASSTPTTTSTRPVVAASSTPAAPSSTSPTSSSPVSTTTRALASTMSGSDLVVVGSSTIDRSALSSATTITSALIGSETEAVESTSYWTSNGQVYSTVYTSNRVMSSTTGFATATIDPLLATADPSSGGSLSPQSQAIIGGVVGGVGGAILLGGLAFAAWRLRSRKQRERLPQDDPFEDKYGTVAADEHTDGLERYRTNGGTTHPATSVNPSSNF